MPPLPLPLFRRRLRSVELKLLVCDVDGVLTDGGLHYDDNGAVHKRFDVRDGLGIRLLQDIGIEVAFLSGGRGGASECRAAHLGVRHCLVGVTDKLEALRRLQGEIGVASTATAFIGDDLNDLAVRPAVALLVCPADAVPALRRRADWVLRRRGGDGAVRELADRVLRDHGAGRRLARQGWRGGNG